MPLRSRSSVVVSLICLLLAVLAMPRAVVHAGEVLYSSKEFAKLDTFEALAVQDADKLFGKGDYPGAYAAYKAYTIEFAQGRALPYVLLRMGRCLHLVDKRNTAIKAYQDVVDYFPNDVKYAAAALYYIGVCHRQNGNEEKALAAWAKLVKDKDYVQEPRSGTALVALSRAMAERGDHAEATRYHWRAAVAFAKSNPDASRAARDHVIYHYVIRSPNHDKLLEFCNEIGAFGDKPEDSPAYWSHVLNKVLRARLDEQKQVDVSRYWDARMGDRFKEHDDLRVDWISLRLKHDKDFEAWAKRMEAQFKVKDVTIGRVKHWLRYYGKYPKVQASFYEKFGEPLVNGLSNDEKLSLMRHLRHRLRMHDEALKVMRKVRTNDMDDERLRSFAFDVAGYEGEEAFLRTVDKMKDKTFAARTRFDYYYGRARRNGENQKKALAEIPALRDATDDAQEIVWKHATLMQWQGEYEQAIKLYRKANRQPDSTWAIIDCRVALKDYAKAIELTKELESIGGGIAAAACMKAANIYKISGDKAKEVQQLRLVLRRYPKSGQSSQAHQRLENYGVKVIGGDAKAEE